MYINRTQLLTLAFAIATFAPFVASGAERRRNYQELAAASDKVVLGTVGSKTSYFGSDSLIYTDIVVSSDVTIEGEDEATIVVQTLGGTVGDTTMSVSDGPEFPDGESVLVFLKREAGHFAVVGRAAGTVRASSTDAKRALNGAFEYFEGRDGLRTGTKRRAAESYLHRATSALNDRAVSSAAAQVGCYSTDGAKWSATFATYKIGSSIPSAWTASIDAAANTWSSAGAGFRLVNDSGSSNELSYLDLVAKYGSSYSNTYAVTTTWSSTSTGRISRATTEVNTKWAWSPTGEANMADVQGILTHEMGHWMRLLDIYSPAACSEVTMWGTASMGETKKRTLERDDIDGFISLYGGTATTLGTPVLTFPANGATGISGTPTLTWSAASNTSSYDVYLGATPSPGFIGTVTATGYQPGTLKPGTTYYWRVVAKNSSTSASSDTFWFTVADGSGGTTSGPVLTSPTDGATGVSLAPVMRWTAVQGAITYDVYIGTTAAPGRIGSVNATAVTVTGFQPATLYYWKVVARTPDSSFSSVVASFRTN